MWDSWKSIYPSRPSHLEKLVTVQRKMIILAVTVKKLSMVCGRNLYLASLDITVWRSARWITDGLFESDQGEVTKSNSSSS